MSQMFSDPQMMSSMQEMMKNPDFMANAMKMMNNPEISKMFGGLDGDNNDNNESNENTEGIECNGCDDCEPIEIENTFSCDDIVTLSGLKSEEYNGQTGIVREYLNEKERYSVYIEEMDKTISLKEENLTLVLDEEIEGEDTNSSESIENVD